MIRSPSTVAILLAVVLGISTAPVSRVFAAPGDHKHSEEKHKLGRQKIGAYTVSVIMIGEPEAAHPVDFDVKLFDNDKDPKAIRVWIGTEDGKGSEKVKLEKKTTTFGGRVKMPDTKPENCKVWVEVETESGTAKGVVRNGRARPQALTRIALESFDECRTCERLGANDTLHRPRRHPVAGRPERRGSADTRGMQAAPRV
jgi:hypothetical protein